MSILDLQKAGHSVIKCAEVSSSHCQNLQEESSKPFTLDSWYFNLLCPVMAWTIKPRVFLSSLHRIFDFFLSNSGKNSFVCLNSVLDFHLWFHFLYIASVIFFLAMPFGGGKSTLLNSFFVPVLAR